MDVSVEDKYVYTTQNDSIREKDWAAGSSEKTSSNEFIILNSGTSAKPIFTSVYKEVKYPPSWWKTFDEGIVNMLDHLVRCLGTPNPVTIMKVSFDSQTGRIRIFNNGPGIDVVIHKVASEKRGVPTYVPTFIMDELFQGSNRVKAEDNIIGGTNGVGSKIANFLSIDFAVETTDESRGFLFQQKWTEGGRKTSGPIIVNINEPAAAKKLTAEQKAGHTVLSFIPDYIGQFKYKLNDNKLLAEEAEDMCGLIRTRTVFAAAYAHYSVNTYKQSTKQKLSIYFNDELLNFKSISDIASVLFPDQPQVKALITPVISVPKKPGKTTSKAAFKYPWEVCVVVPSATVRMPTEMFVSNVNGVFVRRGKHIKKIADLIVEGVKDKISKLFNEKDLNFSPSYISNNVFIFVNSKIPNPKWTGQRKDELDTDVRKLSGYTLDAKFITQITGYIGDKISNDILSNQKQATGKKKSTGVTYEKYHKAERCGTKDSSKCMLIAAEGDSAMTQVENGISHNEGYKFLGVISTGGVPLNVRKHCTIIEKKNVNDGTVTRYIKKSATFEKNIFWEALFNITGLNPTYHYLPGSASYAREMAELKYGSFCAAVDQDVDGKGNILGSFISAFGYLFPNLLNAGYLKWFCTPIMRAYPLRGGKIVEFYSDLEYERWLKTGGPGGKPAVTDNYNIKYYKGLGTHSRDEIIHMFKTFRSHLYTYCTDAKSHEYMHIYYGNDPNLRKIELSKPTINPSKELLIQQESTMKISATDHLTFETNLYQKDNLDRKLNHVIDGQNQAGRKILDGILKAFKINKPMKIATLAGYVSEHENYHHGEESLNGSLTNRGFIAPGGYQLPPLIPLSNFGTMKMGGADASKPRYIFGMLNAALMGLLYPPIDYSILPFNFDEGTRSEPKYFVPIIPMAITESTEVPGHGWKLETWARDVFKVIDNVRRIIKSSDDPVLVDGKATYIENPNELKKKIRLLKMPPCVYRGAPYEWTGSFKDIRGEPYSIGKYEYVEDTKRKSTSIRITALPLRKWVMPYIAMLEKKAISADGIIEEGDPKDVILNTSDDMRVNIVVKLQDSAVERLAEMGDSFFTDGVEEYFQLRDHMVSHINCMNIDGSVLEFGSNYEDVFYHWFPIRRQFYIARVNRQELLLRLKIVCVENIIRYINECMTMNLPKRKEAEMIKILLERGYAKIHRGKLYQPKFTPTDQLEQVILYGPKANYDYLLDITDRGKSEESIAKHTINLEALQLELSELIEVSCRGKFRGAAIWESELDKLEKVIVEGQKTFWQFGDFGKYKFE